MKSDREEMKTHFISDRLEHEEEMSLDKKWTDCTWQTLQITEQKVIWMTLC